MDILVNSMKLDNLLEVLPGRYTPADEELIERAYRFAAKAHRRQKRVSGEPYINHCLAVAIILAEMHVPSEIVAAGLLHDTLEDTETTPEEIRTLFGEKILAWVEEVSDDKSLPKQERKRLQILHASSASQGAKQIKIADKICNIRDLIDRPPLEWSLERKQQYLEWSDQVMVGLRGCNPLLETLYDQVLEKVRQYYR